MKIYSQFFLLLYGLVLICQPARAMVLSDVVDAVVREAPQLKAAQAGVEQTRSRVGEVRASRYPRLEIRSSYMRGNNPVYVFGSLLEQKEFGLQNFAINSLNDPGSLTNIKTALDVGMPLFTGFELNSLEKRQKWNRDSAQADYQMADQNIRLEAVELALSVVMKQALLDEIRNRIVSAEKEIESAKKLNAKGLVLGSDYFSAQALHSSFLALEIQWKNEFNAAGETLKQVMRNSTVPVVDGQLSLVVYSVPSIEELTALAFLHRPDIKKSEVALSIVGETQKQSRRSFLPTLEAFGSIETNTEDFSSNPNNHTWGVRSHFPIGDPTYWSRTHTTQAMVKGAQSQKDAIEDRLRRDVIEAYHSLKSIQDSLPLIEASRTQAEKSLSLFRPLYREGRQSILDVLRAEEGLLKAQEAFVGALAQLHMAYARLHWAIGQLDSQVISTIQSRLEKRL